MSGGYSIILNWHANVFIYVFYMWNKKNVSIYLQYLSTIDLDRFLINLIPLCVKELLLLSHVSCMLGIIVLNPKTNKFIGIIENAIDQRETTSCLLRPPKTQLLHILAILLNINEFVKPKKYIFYKMGCGYPLRMKVR